VGESAVALASLSGAGEVDGVTDRLDFSKKMGATQNYFAQADEEGTAVTRSCSYAFTSF
jgi:hypothetical protein